MALTGVFARGLVNGCFVLLALWGVFYLVTAKRGWFLAPKALPAKLLWGAAIYFAALMLSALAGSEYGRSFKHIVTVAYLLAPLPLTWLALTQWPNLIKYLVPLYGLGLMAAGLMTFTEAGFGLSCVRAKASLGIIELGAVLAQLTPIMALATALAIRARDRLKTVFFAAALILAYVAHLNSCSRIAFLTTPVITLILLWAHRRVFTLTMKLVLVALALVLAIATLTNKRIVERFAEMGVEKGNYNNEVRINHWKQGWKVFQENPILGVGPRAIPNAPPLNNPAYPKEFTRTRDKYYHAHQVFITVLAESGVIGLIGFLALHLAPIALLWPFRRDPDPERMFWVWAAIAVASQLFFNGLTDNVFTLKPLMYIYWTVTGAALWVTLGNKPAP
jgi:O-antigen ligase